MTVSTTLPLFRFSAPYVLLLAVALIVATGSVNADAEEWRHGSALSAGVLDTNGRMLWTLDSRGVIGVWNAMTGDNVSHFETSVTNADQLSLSSDGRSFAVTDRAGGIVVFDASVRKRLIELKGDISWLPSGGFVTWDHRSPPFGFSILRYSIGDKGCETTAAYPLDVFQINGITPIGELELAVACTERRNGEMVNEILKFDLTKGRVVGRVVSKVPFHSNELVLGSSRIGGTLLATGNTNVVEVFDMNAMKSVLVMDAGDSQETFRTGSLSRDSLLFSVGGDRVLIRKVSGTMGGCDLVGNDRQVGTSTDSREGWSNALARYLQSVCSLDFAPDGKHLFAIRGTGAVCVWRLSNCKLVSSYLVARFDK